MLKGKILLLFFVALGALTSCNDDDDANPNRLTKESFMQQAAASDLFEIQTGEMAAQKGTMNDVKTFGQLLVTDHTMTSNQLKTLAQQIGVTLPTTLPQDKQERKTRLEGLTGAAFDKEFANMQVVAHQEAIALYERAEDEVEDDQVENFAEGVLPHLRMHLQEAQRLVEALK